MVVVTCTFLTSVLLMDVQAEYLKEVTVLLDMFDFLYQTQGDFVTFPTHTDNNIEEGGYPGESAQTAQNRVNKGEGIGHTIILKLSVGASGMHVSGAWHKEGSMKYGNNAGTYSSFPADLRHRSVKLGHQAGILKIAFFFTIIRNKPKATPKTKTKTTSKLGVRRSTRVFKS